MRYSKEREAVYQYVLVNKTHPTAIDIYTELKKTHETLSLGTVYRNLTQLVENGKLIRLNITGEHDKFDATTESHIHLYCLKCKKITDIMNTDKHIEKSISKSHGFKVLSHDLLFKGICKNCSKKERK